MATSPPVELGQRAPDFNLIATNDQFYSLSDVAGDNGTVIVFICNHCPYVKAVAGRLAEDARTLAAEGIGFAAICSNDASTHPEDSFQNMRRFAEKHDFEFPYLHDESQEIAHAYGAVCTPDFFGLNAKGEIQYRGRLDEGRTEPVRPGVRRELVDAMREIARTGKGPREQIPSVGCSIKWKGE